MSKCILDHSFVSTCPHPHLVCQHCRKRYCIGNHDDQSPSMHYCPTCWRLASPHTELVGSVACIIPGCENRTDQGGFDGPLCTPCSDFVRGRKSPFSQAYRNEVARFTEWFSKMQQGLAPPTGNFELSLSVTETKKPTQGT